MSETNPPQLGVHRIVMTLERIAVALEKIAGNVETKRAAEQRATETPFPWDEVSQRVRNCEYNSRKGEGQRRTCEELIAIGRLTLLGEGWNGGWRNFGPKCVAELDVIMDRLGFTDEWLKS